MADTLAQEFARISAARQEELGEVRQAARKLADKFPQAYWRECDKEAKYPWDFVNAFAKAGWMRQRGIPIGERDAP